MSAPRVNSLWFSSASLGFKPSGKSFHSPPPTSFSDPKIRAQLLGGKPAERNPGAPRLYLTAGGRLTLPLRGELAVSLCDLAELEASWAPRSALTAISLFPQVSGPRHPGQQEQELLPL